MCGPSKSRKESQKSADRVKVKTEPVAFRLSGGQHGDIVVVADPTAQSGRLEFRLHGSHASHAPYLLALEVGDDGRLFLDRAFGGGGDDRFAALTDEDSEILAAEGEEVLEPVEV